MSLSIVTWIFAGMFYIAALVMVIGVLNKIVEYSRTPVPLKIPIMPAPTTQSGVVYRMFKEVVLFASLFRATKWTWVFGWLFHFGLVLVMLRHLRYFTEPVWFWVDIVQPFGKYASIMMMVGMAGLLARRFLVDRVRYISTPSDYLMLVLLLAIGMTGILMTFFVHTDIVAVKAFFLGLMVFDIQPLPVALPQDLILLSHLAMVAFLMLIFPFSKLIHAVGVFFSPTLNQADNSREKRHIPAAWTARVDKNN